jgi:hypothetical protein
VEDEVAELVGSVEPVALAGLLAAEEDERLAVPVEAVGVEILGVVGQGEDSYAVGLEQVDQVADGLFAQAPPRPHLLGCQLRGPSRQRRNVRCGEVESVLEPVVDQDRDASRVEPAVTGACCHLAQGTEADRLNGDLLEVVAGEEVFSDAERGSESCERLRGRVLVLVLVGGQAGAAQSRFLGELGQRPTAALACRGQTGGVQHGGNLWSAKETGVSAWRRRPSRSPRRWSGAPRSWWCRSARGRGETCGGGGCAPPSP